MHSRLTEDICRGLAIVFAERPAEWQSTENPPGECYFSDPVWTIPSFSAQRLGMISVLLSTPRTGSDRCAMPAKNTTFRLHFCACVIIFDF